MTGSVTGSLGFVKHPDQIRPADLLRPLVRAGLRGLM